MSSEVHFKKSDGIFKATLKQGKLSVQISFPSDESADEDEMEEGLKILHAVLVLKCGATEAGRVFLGLSKKLEKAKK